MSSIVSQADLIERGGVYYNIAGSNPVEVLNEATKTMALPKCFVKQAKILLGI